MNTNNTAIWDGVCKPPATALKQIKGGRLQGMTDINPQWRYRAMTETFGPCGFGWVYTIDRLWTEKGVGEEVMAFAQVSLKVRSLSQWSEPIVGIGGSALIALEKAGPKASDECYKMAITDAMSVAMKMLGVGADIYMGRWDGAKYKDEAPEPKAEPVRMDEATRANHIAAIEGADTLETLASAYHKAIAAAAEDQEAQKAFISLTNTQKAKMGGKK